MDLISVTVAPLAKAILLQVGKAIGGGAVKGARTLAFGDQAEKALERALTRAFVQVQLDHGDRLGQFDINVGFLEHEGAEELAKTLMPSSAPSAVQLAACAVDSVGSLWSADERYARIDKLQPVFAEMLRELQKQLRAEPVLNELLGRADTARTADAMSGIAATMGAAPPSEDDQVRYLSWLIDQHRYIRTVGVVRNTTVQLPLDKVFIGLRARHDRHPGDRAREWFEKERKKATALLEAGRLDAVEYEAVLDQLQAQSRHKFAAAGDERSDEAVPVLDEVRDTAQLVILGDPGSGKTTLLRYLALRHARGLRTGEPVEGSRARFPIYVRLAEYASLGHPRLGISDFLVESLHRRECRVPGLEVLLRQRLEAGQCLVLLDGLDEVVSADSRRDVVAALVNFVSAHSGFGNRFVVTSRVAGYQASPLPQPFLALRLQAMDADTISRFLRIYCQRVERAETPNNSAAAINEAGAREAAAIEQALQTNAGVRRLATNPLLLTALVLVHRASGRLPHRRVEAYKEVTIALGRTWRSSQGVRNTDLPDERMLTTWLTELGAWMHQHRPDGAAARIELLRILGPLWAKHQGVNWDPETLSEADPLDTDAGRGIQEFVEKTERHTGLLVERAPERYGFAHLTFEEYYAGRALVFRGRATQRVESIRGRLHDPRYAEPILLALGLIGIDYADEIDELVEEAVYPGNTPSAFEDLLGRDFLMMLRVLADDPPIQTATIDIVINQAIDEVLTPSQGRFRFISYRSTLKQKLAALNGTRAGDRCITAVNRKASSLIPDAIHSWISLAEIVADFGELLPETVARLREIIVSNEIQAVTRMRAALILVDTRALTMPLMIALLHVAVDRPKSPEGLSIRIKLHDDLAQKGVMAAVLGDIAVSDHIEVPVRLMAIAVRYRDNKFPLPVIAVLTRIASADENKLSERMQAASILADAKKLPTSVATILYRILSGDLESAIQLRIVSVLVDAGELSEPAIVTLIQIATSAPDPEVRTSAVSILIRVKPGAVSEPVMRGLSEIVTNDDLSAHLRARAASILAENEVLSKTAATAVAKIVLGENFEVPISKKRVLNPYGYQSLTEPLKAALNSIVTNDPDLATRVRAASALAMVGDLRASAVITLTEIVTSSDIEPGMRAQAASALARAGKLQEPAATALTQIVTSGDIEPGMRVQAASALARAGEPQDVVTTALTQILTSSDIEPVVRGQAATTLARAGRLQEPAVVALTQIVTDSDIEPGVRVHAGLALAGVGVVQESVITALTQVATSRDTAPGLRVLAASRVAEAVAGEMGKLAVMALTQIATSNLERGGQESAIAALEEARPTAELRAMMVKLLQNEEDHVRSAAAATLVEWARRNPQNADSICGDLADACVDPGLIERLGDGGKKGRDYAYESLAVLMAELAPKNDA